MAFKYGTTSPTAIKYGNTELTILKHGIPKEYQSVEYIESTGTQYINTGVGWVNGSSLTYEVKLQFPSTANTVGSGHHRCVIGCNNGRLNVAGILSNFSATDWHTASVSWNSGNTGDTISYSSYVDGVSVGTSSAQPYDSNPYLLFACCSWNDSTGVPPYSYDSVRIAEAKFYRNSSLIKHFVPCYRKSDNVIGMYDMVNNAFHTNGGSGNFTKSNNSINGIAVWGKPYSLSISAGSNTSITVNRTSSPNQHASTGTLSSGSVIYYGDVLTISYSVSSGYAINTHTVNGTTFTSGQSFTVTSAISVVTTAQASASWKTVWTGSKQKSISSDTSNIQTISMTGFSGLKTGVPTRITGAFNWYEENESWMEGLLNFSNLEVGKYYYQNTDYTSGDISDFSISTSDTHTRCFWGVSSVSSTSLTIRCRSLYQVTFVALYMLFYGSVGLRVTKIEQYY